VTEADAGFFFIAASSISTCPIEGNGMNRLGTQILFCFVIASAISGDGAHAQSAASSMAAQIERRYSEAIDQYEHDFEAYQSNQRLDESFRGDLSSLAVYLKSVMRGGGDPAVRQLAAVYLPNLRDYDVALKPSVYVEVSRIVPPDSALWKKVAGPGSIFYMASGLPPSDARRFLKKIIAQNADPAIQGRALIELSKVAHRLNDRRLYAESFERLSAYKNVDNLGFEIDLLSPKNKSAIGKQAAIFTLPETGETASPFSNKSLAGKFYLLDFWATWCGPCLGERGALNSAYQKFHGANFEIVSISADKTPEAVRRYQKTHWSMPWVNLFLSDGLKGQVAQEFDINWIGLPHLVLVNPRGQIIALRDELGRDALSQTLSRYLHAGLPTGM
jgi:thiol-disulfide isomerase/thioredoxin